MRFYDLIQTNLCFSLFTTLKYQIKELVDFIIFGKKKLSAALEATKKNL
jgi:hypothetical protein